MSQADPLYHAAGKEALLVAMLERWDAINLDTLSLHPGDACATLHTIVRPFRRTKKPGLLQLFCATAAEATASVTGSPWGL